MIHHHNRNSRHNLHRPTCQTTEHGVQFDQNAKLGSRLVYADSEFLDIDHLHSQFIPTTTEEAS